MEKKKCRDCGETKSVSEFYKQGVRKNGKVFYQTYCKPCLTKRTRGSEAGYKLRNQMRIFDWYEEEGGCVDCGETNPLKLSADHVRGVKAFRIAAPERQGRASLEYELAKCEPRCHNCHQVKTAAELDWFKAPELRDRVTKFEENKEAYTRWGKETS